VKTSSWDGAQMMSGMIRRKAAGVSLATRMLLFEAIECQEKKSGARLQRNGGRTEVN
jgi:hypothetical protein